METAITFPAQDVCAQKPSWTLLRRLGPTAREVNGMWQILFIHSLVWPATLCPLIPKLLLQLFFFSVAFLPPWEIGCQWFVQTCLRDSFQTLQVRQGNFYLKPLIS